MNNGNAWTKRLTHWEHWPFNVVYAPLVPLWLWYAAKAKALWWFTPANPTLTFAGFDGETKEEMYRQLPFDLYPTTVYIKAGMLLAQVKEKLLQANLTYPLCAKPDAGLKGLLFRKIDDEGQLQAYHEAMPVDYIIQCFLQTPLEVSVFYYRHPVELNGTISGFIQKDRMHVVGNGQQNLWELIASHPNARYRLEEMRIKHEKSLENVLPAGEIYYLAHAANLNRGARFTNLQSQIDERLHLLFDAISHRCQWFYGRFDVKCETVEDLKQGRFCILEFNGAGAEPNHVYNAGYSWPAALRVFAHHWKMLYRIARFNHQQNGIEYWTNADGIRWMKAAREHGRLLEKLDREILM